MPGRYIRRKAYIHQKYIVCLFLIYFRHQTQTFQMPAVTRNTYIPTFWINLDRATNRREFLQQNLNKYPTILATRIPAVDAFQAQKHSITVNKSTIVPYDNEPLYKKHFRCEFTFQELGCTLSHIKAIREAYRKNYAYALILEDDAIIMEDFIEQFANIITNAPRHWNVLQLFSNNEQVWSYSDEWISWRPSHWGTMAYVISARGMRTILDKSQYGHVFTEPCMMTADEVVYYYAKNTYTITFPWFQHFRDTSSIQTVIPKGETNYNTIYKQRKAKKTWLLPDGVSIINKTSLDGFPLLTFFNQQPSEAISIAHCANTEDALIRGGTIIVGKPCIAIQRFGYTLDWEYLLKISNNYYIF